MQFFDGKVKNEEEQQRLRLLLQKKRELIEDDPKDNAPECRRCGRKGHTAVSCIQPKKPTDKE
jgi:hypothetical protein